MAIHSYYLDGQSAGFHIKFWDGIMTMPAFIDTASSEIAGQLKSHRQQKLPSLEVHLLERRITCMTVPAIVESIRAACIEGKKITVANYNVHSFNLSMQLPWFYNFLQSAEIAHCDGMGILKAIGYMGLKLPVDYRASYTLLMPKVLELCNRYKLTIFLLGAKPNYLQAAIANLETQYPNINVQGHHGYFDVENPDENDAIINQINQVKPHILLLGMGMPIQENWARLYRHRLNVNAIMLGGAAIDRMAGIVSDCPTFISNAGLEWLYRLGKEPKRLAARYLLGNPAFLLHLGLGKFYASCLKVNRMPENGNLNGKSNELPATVSTKGKHIGQYLVEAGLLTQPRLEMALSEQKRTGMRLGELLVRKGWINEQTIEYLMKKVILPDRVRETESIFST